MSYVYVFGVRGDNLMKVGYSNVPKHRRGVLRCTYKMPTGEILFAHPCGNDLRAMRVEKRAHALLKSRRIEGEWFLVDVEAAVAAITDAARDPDPSLLSERGRG